MASLREYRKKIKTVKSTQQITKAMKMVAAARLRRAQSRILSARPFAIKMRELLMDLARRLNPPFSPFSKGGDEKGTFAKGDYDVGSVHPHPLFRSHSTNRMAILLVTADKGLCGSFNTNLVKKAGELIRQNSDKEMRFFVVGRKGRDFFKRLGYPLAGEYVGIFNQLSYTHAEIIGRDLIELFVGEELSEIVVIYNEFKSVIQQRLVAERILPVSMSEDWESRENLDFIYEPDKPELMDALLPRYIKSQVYRILLESSAAELGARMTAMDSATKNARELIEILTLKLNRTRQAMITREIAELVGGAEALK